MTGVAPLLDPINEHGQLVVFWCDIVVEHERTAGPQHSRHFTDEARRVREMVRRDSHRDNIEAGVGKRQRFGVGELERHICGTLVADKALGCRQHGRGHVAGNHGAHEWRKGQCGVTTTSGDVQHALITTQPCQFNHALEIGPLSVAHTCDIALGSGTELLLHP